MKYFLSITFFFLLFCLSPLAGYDYIREASKIQNKVHSRIEKELHVHIGGTGGGMMHCIYLFHTTIQTQPVAEKNIYRRLLAAMIQIYLQEINQSKEIRPYLKYFPYDENGIRIFILGDRPTNGRINDKFYYGLSYSRGVVSYDLADRDNTLLREETETYQELLQHINKP